MSARAESLSRQELDLLEQSFRDGWECVAADTQQEVAALIAEVRLRREEELRMTLGAIGTPVRCERCKALLQVRKDPSDLRHVYIGCECARFWPR